MHSVENGMQSKTVLKNINGEITTYVCGTAMQRTVHIKVNCEMDISSARRFADAILKECIYIEKSPKGCNRCEHSPGCPEKEE